MPCQTRYPDPRCAALASRAAPRRAPPRRRVSRLRKNGVNTNGATAKVTFFDRSGKRYAVALLGRYKYVNGSTQQVPLSKNMKFAVTPLVLTPFVTFREMRGLPDAQKTFFGVPRAYYHHYYYYYYYHYY